MILKNDFVDPDTALDVRLYGKYLSFLRRHPIHAVRLIWGIVVPPHEGAMLETAWDGYKINIYTCSRGTSKSFTIGSLFPPTKALLFKNISTLVASASKFRGGKLVLTDSSRLVRGSLKSQKVGNNWGVNSLQHKAVTVKKDPDMWHMDFTSNSNVYTIPTSNEESVRGMRANVLVVDERNVFDGLLIQQVYLPFLAVGSDFESPAKGSDENQVFYVGTIDYTYRDWFKEIQSARDVLLLQFQAYQAMLKGDWTLYDRIMTDHGYRVKNSSLALTRYDYTDLLIPTTIGDYKVKYPGAILGKQIKYDERDKCNPYESPILMSDWSCKPIGKINVGDEIIGVDWDEHHKGEDYTRSKIVKTKVIAINSLISSIVKITLQSGRVIRCTPDHKWFTGYSEKTGHSKFLPAKIGRPMRFLCEPDVYINPLVDVRYLAGMFDAEGCVSYRKKGHWGFSSNLSISQSKEKNPEIYNEIKKQLDLLGMKYSEREDGVGSFIFGTHWKERRKFLLACRPFIKAEKLEQTLFKMLITEKDRPIKIEYDGEEPVYSLQTETGNYVCWGYVSKNCEIVYTYPVDKRQIEQPLDEGIIDRDTWAAEHRNLFIQADGNVYPYDLIESVTGPIFTLTEEKNRGWKSDVEGMRYCPPVMFECADPCVLGVDIARTQDFAAFVVIRIGALAQGEYNLKTHHGGTPWSNVIWAEQHQQMTVKEIVDQIRGFRARYNIVCTRTCPGIVMDARGGGSNVRDELAVPSPPVDPDTGLPLSEWKPPQIIFDPEDKEDRFGKDLLFNPTAWGGLRLLMTTDTMNQEFVGFTKGQMQTSKLYLGTSKSRVLIKDPAHQMYIGFIGVDVLKHQLLRVQAILTPMQKSVRYEMPGDTTRIENKKDLFMAYLYAGFGLREHLTTIKVEKEAPVAYAEVLYLDRRTGRWRI